VVTFYRGQTAPHVEFPLDLDLPTLMVAGLEAAKPGDAPMDEHRHHLDRMICAATASSGEDLLTLEGTVWPALVARVHSLVKQPTKLRDVLKGAARTGGLTAGDVLRGLEILHTAGLVTWKD